MTNTFFDDMMKMAGGAMNTADAARHEAENWFKAKMEDVFKGMNLVTREEFTKLEEMLAQSRIEQESLKAEIASLKK
jgi:BMFP domain-containing protein YqiC